MKTLTLDVSEWICGNPSTNDDPANHIGEGNTRLYNDEGYMCCLGQFALQLSEGLQKQDMLDCPTPDMLDGYYIPDLVSEERTSTELAEAAIYINDSDSTTVEEKIVELVKLFAEHGYQIEIINDEKMRE